jgi:hypothetical protein
MEPEALIRAVATGQGSVSDLAPIGVFVSGDPPDWSVTLQRDIPEVRVSLGELSTGLLAAWATGTDLAEWALVTRELVVVDEEDSPPWETLMNALWAAAFGEGVPDEALVLARRLTP